MLYGFTIAAIGIQLSLMTVDEFVFHKRRGLSVFESYGHVADSALFGLALCVPGYMQYSSSALYAFIALGILSSLLITKDEWEHSGSCEPAENWVHALLFINHPVLLFCIGLLWWRGEASLLRSIFPVAVFCFSVYQALAWIPKARKVS